MAAKLAPSARPLVDFRNVWLACHDGLAARDRFAVQDVALLVNEGAFIVIVGASGCGTPTLMKPATGLAQQLSGGVQQRAQRDHARHCGHRAGRNNGRRFRQRRPDADRRVAAAQAAGVRRAGRDRRDVDDDA